MAKPLAERQISFRIKSKAQGGMRLDMWLPSEEADKLRKLMAWNGKTGPKVFLDLINNAWKEEVDRAAHGGHADAQFEYAMRCIKENIRINHNHGVAKFMFRASIEKGYCVGTAYNNLGVLARIAHINDFGKLRADVEEAVKCLQISATHGNRVAYYKLGGAYETGDGVERLQSSGCMAFEER